MVAVSFVHQKGGTGKSTLAISSAVALAQAGNRVLLLDADYQGTSSEWGNRFGHRFQVATRSQVQPILHNEMPGLREAYEWIVIDSPPTLSEMTESVVRASDTVIIPVRPALPDIWALPWLVAIIRKLGQREKVAVPRVVFNQYAGEDLAPLREQISAWNLPVHPHTIPVDLAFPAVFSGRPLPGPLAERVLRLIDPGKC